MHATILYLVAQLYLFPTLLDRFEQALPTSPIRVIPSPETRNWPWNFTQELVLQPKPKSLSLRRHRESNSCQVPEFYMETMFRNPYWTKLTANFGEILGCSSGSGWEGGILGG